MADETSSEQTTSPQPGETVGPSTASRPESASASAKEAIVVPEVVQTSSITPRSVAAPPDGADGFISWTASEFIAHEKSAGWYILLTLGAAILAFFVWLLEKSIFSVGIIVVCAAMFGVFASRKPRDLLYRLDDSGLTIGQKFYSYSNFHSFSITPEGALNSIDFLPLKRFAVPLAIYYDPTDEEKIVALLAERLPLEPARRDPVDRLVSRMRF